MKNHKTKSWQTCAAEIYIIREILKEKYEDDDIYGLMSGNWQVNYVKQNDDLIPNVLKLEKNTNF